MSFLALLCGLAALFSTTAAITAVTSQSQASITGEATLAQQTSYSFTYTVTTPTTVWNAPTFTTSTPGATVPACSDSMCPTLDHRYCIDSLGHTYGVLCDTLLSGIVITNSGKRFMVERDTKVKDVEARGVEKRDYTATFEGCSGFCDDYEDPAAFCTGVAYNRGYCMAYDTITGTFHAAGQIAALKQVS